MQSCIVLAKNRPRPTLIASLSKDDHSFFKNAGVVMLEWLMNLGIPSNTRKATDMVYIQLGTQE
jgi:hypothetical protein